MVFPSPKRGEKKWGRLEVLFVAIVCNLMSIPTVAIYSYMHISLSLSLSLSLVCAGKQFKLLFSDKQVTGGGKQKALNFCLAMESDLENGT